MIQFGAISFVLHLIIKVCLLAFANAGNLRFHIVNIRAGKVSSSRNSGGLSVIGREGGTASDVSGKGVRKCRQRVSPPLFDCSLPPDVSVNQLELFPIQRNAASAF